MADYKKWEVNVGENVIRVTEQGELFVNDYNNYFLLSRTIDSDNNIYEVLDNDQIYAGKPSDKSNVRVTMYLKPDIILEEGLGTRDKPYIIK